ncbi:MAG: PKD domain-containing protein, partial [Methanospirillum sp.]|uniref:PKD domain-containing protein n=1 Tax=Methanospirillum sp. TaxID=45200 RepID=UPI00236CAD7A
LLIPVFNLTEANPGTLSVWVTNLSTGRSGNLLDSFEVLPPRYYSINATVTGNGTISPSGNLTIQSSHNQTFTLTPDPGNILSEVLVDGLSIGSTSAYSFTNIQANHTIYAYFREKDGLSLINSSANQWSNIIPVGKNYYPEYSNQSYIIQANPGAFLANVSIDTDVINASIKHWTFTNLTDDHAIHVEGEPVTGQVLVFFNATPRYGQVPLSVNFSSEECLGSPTSYFWQFGDGITDGTPNPVHVYQTPGVYTVSLRATNDHSGGYGQWSNLITVTRDAVPEPTPTPIPGIIIADFRVSPASGSAPLTVQFTDLSSGNPVSWFWDFGDGYTSDQQNVTHTYNSKGSYDVRLLVKNSLTSGGLEKPDLIVVS